VSHTYHRQWRHLASRSLPYANVGLHRSLPTGVYRYRCGHWIDTQYRCKTGLAATSYEVMAVTRSHFVAATVWDRTMAELHSASDGWIWCEEKVSTRRAVAVPVVLAHSSASDAIAHRIAVAAAAAAAAMNARLITEMMESLWGDAVRGKLGMPDWQTDGRTNELTDTQTHTWVLHRTVYCRVISCLVADAFVELYERQTYCDKWHQLGLYIRHDSHVCTPCWFALMDCDAAHVQDI